MADRHVTKPYPLRMGQELRQALEQAAESGGRSLHAEIVRRLQDSFDAPILQEADADMRMRLALFEVLDQDGQLSKALDDAVDRLKNRKAAGSRELPLSSRRRHAEKKRGA